MLVVRQEQMKVLERAAIQAFEDRTYRHLQQWFPHHCELLGEDQVRRVIRHGWQKANSYDLTAECCVRSYIEFMCLLGGGFDTDILLPWAAEILNDKSSSDQVARGDRLYHRTWDYIDHIARDYRDAAGRPTTARFMDDLRGLRDGGEETVLPAALPRFLTLLEMRFQRLFPAKCAYVGEARVRQAVAAGVKEASGYGIMTERGATLFTAMKFVLGGGFDTDLLLPWASATLNDRSVTNQRSRVDKLYRESVAFLRRWWDLSSGTEDPRNVLG